MFGVTVAGVVLGSGDAATAAAVHVIALVSLRWDLNLDGREGLWLVFFRYGTPANFVGSPRQYGPRFP